MEEFSRIKRLPPYVFNITTELKSAARKRGEDIIDFGMGNPDGATPKAIVDKLIEAVQRPVTHRYSVSRGFPGCARRSATGTSGATRSSSILTAKRLSPSAPRKASPICAWRRLTAGIRCWCPTPVTPFTFMGR